MISWLPLAIPVITAVVLLIFFKHKTVWWEFLVPFGVSIVLVGIFKISVETALTTDTEFWGGYVTKAQYYEDWNEYIHRTCTRQVACGTDSKGRTRYCTETYDCSYVDHHPPYWQILESNGFRLRISKSRYRWYKQRFKTKERFIDLHRNYHTNDGDMYEVSWDRSEETLDSVTTTHSYENRVQASQSTFGYYEVNPKGLFKYPKPNSNHYMQAILGKAGPTQKAAERKLQILNAKLGRKKQVRVFVLVFHGKTLDTGHDQEHLWTGGNKNEFVITIGTGANDAVQWCHVFSWTEAELLKVETRKFIEGQEKLDLVALADWLYPKIEASFVRMPFAKFSYLTVEPPLWMVFLALGITLLVNVGLSFWIILNDIEDLA